MIDFTEEEAGFGPSKPASIYAINVREKNGQFVLCNGTAIAGDRLVKHDDPPFPLAPTGLGLHCAWNTYPDRECAGRAAVRLQRYLDKIPAEETGKKKGKKKAKS